MPSNNGTDEACVRRTGEPWDMTDSRRLLVVALAGGLGGLVNATLCYLEWPEPVQDTHVTFHWHVMPGGFVHGCVLAAIPFAASAPGRQLTGALRWVASIVVGWCAGYLSWIPLDLSIGESLPKALAWPFNGEPLASALWTPLLYFGVVAGLQYLWMSREARGTSLWTNVLAASTAASVGSLWWWASWGPWYFSPLHGIVWGSTVGSATALRSRGHRTTE